MENHLVGEVAGALQELITEAEATVQSMNDDLEARPTSTGMALRLVWRTAKGAPDGLEADPRRDCCARPSTRGARPTARPWATSCARRITDDRADNPADTWHDQLTRAFDYRAWHEFGIQRRAGRRLDVRPPVPRPAASGSWPRPFRCSPPRRRTTRPDIRTPRG